MISNLGSQKQQNMTATNSTTGGKFSPSLAHSAMAAAQKFGGTGTQSEIYIYFKYLF
jgi:hypothetical protein